MRLVASDFDGTICRDHVVSAEDAEAITRWQTEGNLFIVVTGRGKVDPFLHTRGFAADYYVYANGGRIFDKEMRPVWEKKIPICHAAPLEEWARRKDNSYTLLSEDLRGSMYQFTASFKNDEQAREFESFVLRVKGDYLTPFLNHNTVDVPPKGVDKAGGVLRIADALGVKREDIFAVGDGANDVPMLKAFHGFAMERSAPEAHAAVKGRCATIAELLEKIRKI